MYRDFVNVNRYLWKCHFFNEKPCIKSAVSCAKRYVCTNYVITHVHFYSHNTTNVSKAKQNAREEFYWSRNKKILWRPFSFLSCSFLMPKRIGTLDLAILVLELKCKLLWDFEFFNCIYVILIFFFVFFVVKSYFRPLV